MSASPRTELANRLADSYTCNPRDWAEPGIARQCAVDLVAGLTDAQVDHALAHRLTIPATR